MQIKTKLKELRTHMTDNQIDAYIIPSSDNHQSEYVALHWQIRQWITGFSGSAGTAMVTQDFAGLWTDSRYFLQAEMQLAQNEFVLCKDSQHGQPGYITWLTDNLQESQRVGFDGRVFSLEQYRNIDEELSNHGLELDHDVDIITPIWTDRPSLPQTTIFEHDISFAGRSREQKIEKVRDHLSSIKTDHLLVCALDDIAYVLNIRASDVESNPVSIGFLVIGQKSNHYFGDGNKLKEGIRKKLIDANLQLHDYNDLRSFLSQIPIAESISLDPSSTSIQIYHSISTDLIVEERSCIMKQKAIKSPEEISHVQNAMIKDGAALAKSYYWLDQTLVDRTVSEVELAEKIAKNRASMRGYHHESFDAIVGYRGNGAIIHYKPEKETCADIKAEGMLLVDSGGQYEDGTTDTTRTFSLGNTSNEEKKAYTLVLKGLIGLTRAIFPDKTRGIQLDTLARQHLWSHHKNFNHGTGHGVGYFLNVHEPPQGFAPGLSERGTTEIEEGMLTSNEPGYYKEGHYGIRLENLIVAKKEDTEGFLSFDTLTLYPFEAKLLDTDLLTLDEREWINGYHRRVYKELSPKLNEAEKTWLEKKCQSL